MSDNPNSTINCAIYLRISRDKTGERLGVERQDDGCTEHVTRRGWRIYGTYEDNDRSATKRNVKRVGFEQLLRDIDAGHVQVVVAQFLDRLIRSPWDKYRFYELCQRKGVLLSLVKGGDLDMSSPIGRAAAGMLAEVASIEMDFKSERQKDKNLQTARAGKPHVTHRMLGFEADCVTHKPDEIECLHLMAKLVLDGASWQEAAWQLNDRGYRTSQGNKFIGLTVRRTLSNKRYVGIRVYEGVEYRATWEPVFDQETWDHLQLISKLRREAKSQRTVGRKFLLTGLLYCGNRGNMLTGVTEKHSRTMATYRAYRCFRVGRTERQGGCGKVFRNADTLEEFIKSAVLYRLDTPAVAKLMTPKVDASKMTELLGKRTAIQARINDLIDDYTTDNEAGLTRQEFARAKQAAQSALDGLEADITRLAGSQKAIDLPLNQTLAEAWDGHRNEWRRQLLDLVIEKVTIQRGNNNKTVRRADGSFYRFNPELLEISWKA